MAHKWRTSGARFQTEVMQMEPVERLNRLDEKIRATIKTIVAHSERLRKAKQRLAILEQKMEQKKTKTVMDNSKRLEIGLYALEYEPKRGARKATIEKFGVSKYTVDSAVWIAINQVPGFDFEEYIKCLKKPRQGRWLSSVNYYKHLKSIKPLDPP